MTQQQTTKFIIESIRVAKTTAFRYSLLFTVAFSILTGISMVMIYQTAEQEISQQIDAHLYSESSRLKRVMQYRRTMDIRVPMVGVTERIPTEPSMSYCIVHQQTLPEDYRPRSIQNFIFINSDFSDLCDLHPGHNLSDDPMRVIISPIDSAFILITGYDTRSQRRLLTSMLNIVYMVTGLLLLASFIGSFMISRNITNSIARISRTARHIVDGDFSDRIRTTENDSDELNQLANDLNHMLDRIEGLISSQRQVTNNIAHDLRSPLNRLRNRMEVALLDKHIDCAELRNVIVESVQDADNLLKTFNALLNIAQVEARAKDDFEQISVTTIGEEISELYEVLTEEGEHSFSADIEHQLTIMGNRQLLAQAIINLLDNAVKYTPEGGHISLSAKKRRHHVIVTVSDNGKGIPDAQRHEVLKRFVRLDSARSTPGNGLGLSLVSAIVALHGGSINLLDNNPGLKIELSLPDVSLFHKYQKQDSSQKQNIAHK